VTELRDSKGKVHKVRSYRCPHCWQLYATAAEADECLTKHGHQITD
jgi:hypothetical protein